MRCLLITLVLIINIIAIIKFIKPPISNSLTEEYGRKVSIFGLENQEESQLTFLRKRRKANLYAARRLRYNPFTKKPSSSSHKPHKHRREYSFILRCPKLNTEYKKAKLGVEWSLNSSSIFRVLSDGRKFSSFDLTDIEEWRSINGKLNLIAYGPKPEKRYKFEFEEARGWFSLKLKNLTMKDIGNWKCLIRIKFYNGTIYEFESRKRVNYALIHGYKNRTEAKSEVITYSEAPLFSFSKNDGETAVFSRVDRSRDLLSYVRSLADSEVPKTIFIEPKKRKNPKNSSSSIPKLDPYLFIFIFSLIILKIN